MSSSSTNRLSISNDSGALMSSIYSSKSRGNRFNCLNEFVDILNIYFYIKNIDISKDFKQQRLPSITGFEASGPISPSPKTAVPFVITATKLPLAVYLYTLLTSFDF
jgi:hypothetical protein